MNAEEQETSVGWHNLVVTRCNGTPHPNKHPFSVLIAGSVTIVRHPPLQIGIDFLFVDIS